jgi:hypothetical protein
MGHYRCCCCCCSLYNTAKQHHTKIKALCGSNVATRLPHTERCQPKQLLLLLLHSLGNTKTLSHEMFVDKRTCMPTQ